MSERCAGKRAEPAEITADPVHRCRDLYAFVSPDRPETVTVIATYSPTGEDQPALLEFAADVRYEIHIDDGGDGRPDPHISVPVPHRAAR